MQTKSRALQSGDGNKQTQTDLRKVAEKNIPIFRVQALF